MTRTHYKGYVIDTDDLGRPYIYNTASPYSEESDRILVYIDEGRRPVSQIRAIIDARITTGQDVRHAVGDPYQTPQSRYDSKATTSISLKLNRGTDADILAQLEQEPNRQGYIKSLIRADIANR